MNGRAKVLVFGYTTEEQGRIDDAFHRLGIPPSVQLQRSQGDLTIGELIEGSGGAGTIGVESDARMVLFADVSDTGTLALIRLFRSLDVRRPIFATLTDTNREWTLAHLLDELIAERDSLGG